jgi:hypothetical protein
VVWHDESRCVTPFCCFTADRSGMFVTLAVKPFFSMYWTQFAQQPHVGVLKTTSCGSAWAAGFAADLGVALVWP